MHISAVDYTWPRLEPLWNLLREELIRQGWIEQDQAEQQSSALVEEHVEEMTILETEKSKVLSIIPDHLWDWTAVALWYDMNSSADIGEKCGVSSGAVLNRLSELRRYYPKAKIFTDKQRQKAFHDQRRKLMIRGDMG